MKPSAQVFDESCALKCDLAAEILRSAGNLRLQVTGSSMLPTIWPGDVLTIRRAGSGDVSAGDIVLVGRKQRLAAHRVIEIIESCDGTEILTRGDSMAALDPPVSDADLLGKVASIVRDKRHFVPRSNLRFYEHMIGVFLRNVPLAARVIIYMRSILISWRKTQTFKRSQIQTRIQSISNRAVSCQN